MPPDGTLGTAPGHTMQVWRITGGHRTPVPSVPPGDPVIAVGASAFDAIPV